MTKGELMKAVYTEEERRNIDTAIPQELWAGIDTWSHVMNYNDSVFGKLENMLEIAIERNIVIPD